VFTIVVEHASYTSDGGSVITIGKLRLVDLAGSEKIDAEAKYQQQTETKNINLSLHTFGKVVMTLTSSGSSHIPYRDSKLTRILQDSLGGNCKTTMITTITPTASCYMESLNTLKFAKRAKHVKNNAIINKDVSQKALLSAYQEEIKKLREQLNKKGQVIDEEQLMELEKEKKTAQQEKDKVLSELARQKQLYKEAEEQRKQLLKQIENMEKMFLHGGSNEGNEDVIQKAIEEEREKIFSEAEIEYKKKLAQLEEEKKRLADEKEQIEKQKEYFAKMRNDFKPDGATKDDSIPPEKLFQKPQGINRMNHRPPPTGASKPHPPFTHQGNLPIVRRLSQPISRSSLPRPPRSPINLTAPRQPFSYTQSIEDALHRYAEALADPNTGIPSQQHQSGARIFTGSDAAHWFTQNMEGITNIDEAVAVGERLIEVGLVSEIQGGNQFIPKDNVFYQFNDTLTGGSPFSSRPASAMSMLSLPTGVYTISGKQRAGSVPLVSTQLSSSSQLSSVSSLTVFNEEPSSAKELLEYYKLTSTKSTPLHIAAITNDRQKIKELVGPSLSVNVTDSNGNTPLMYAAMAGQSKSCSLLVTQLGADIERKNDDKRSPLMLAVMFEHNNTVKSLLK
jgi:kinesin family protein 3/17